METARKYKPRFSPLKSGGRLEITPAVLSILKALDTHGDLGSNYLYHFAKEHAKEPTHISKLLGRMFHGELVLRPLTRLNHPSITNQFIIYRLSDKGRAILAERNLLSRFARKPDGSPEHALMTACITASIEIGARAAGIQFVSQEAILYGAPETTRDARNPLAMPCSINHTITENGKDYLFKSDVPVAPDAFFGLVYPNGYQRYFAVEADRATEPVFRSTISQNSYLQKIIKYRQIVRERTFRKHFGLPDNAGFMVLNVTTHPNNVQLISDYIMKVMNLPGGKDFGSTYMALQHVPYFGMYHVAPPLLKELFEKDWHRAGTTPFNISKGGTD